MRNRPAHWITLWLVLWAVCSPANVDAAAAASATAVLVLSPRVNPCRLLSLNGSSWRRRRTLSHPCAMVLSSSNSSSADAPASAQQRRPSFVARAKIAIGNCLFKGLVEKLFDGADTNNDGAISLREIYTLVLKMYVHINRQSPIRPPSRDKVEALFRSADLDRNGRLSRDEFSRLAIVLASRASTRLLAHKIVSFVLAPLLAFRIVQNLPEKSRKWLADNIATKFRLPTRGDFWKTALTVVFVKTLGDVVVSVVNIVLDAMHLSDDDDEDALYE